MLRIEKLLIESDKTGELFVRYSPIVTATCGASGELRFPSYDCELTGDHEATKRAAVENAEKTVRLWAENLKCGYGL